MQQKFETKISCGCYMLVYSNPSNFYKNNNFLPHPIEWEVDKKLRFIKLPKKENRSRALFAILGISDRGWNHLVSDQFNQTTIASKQCLFNLGLLYPIIGANLD